MPQRSSRQSGLVRSAYAWTTAFVDPLRAIRAARGLPAFVRDYLAYRRCEGAERLAISDMQPALHERSHWHEIDAHYFYVNAWAARHVTRERPRLHVDVGSQIAFVGILAATVPVAFVDFRPLKVRVTGLHSVAADILRLPFQDDSLESLSCLHVAEHIGLGRYGDAIDPAGTRKATAELSRVLAPGGRLLFAVPVGRERVAFNAHRVHDPATICRYFTALTLCEFSGIDDHGVFTENMTPGSLRDNEYACGLFRFTK